MEDLTTDPDATDFDAADLADAILGSGDAHWVPVATIERAPLPLPLDRAATPSSPGPGRALGWVLAFLLFAAVSIATSLAVQLDTSEPPSPQPPECGGLFDPDC